MKLQSDILSACSGLLFALGLLVGWGLLAGSLPPLSPGATAEVVASFYQQNEVRIQFGLGVTLAAMAFLVPFGSALAVQVRRMEGERAVLANAQLGCAILTAGVVTMGMTLFAIASFRPERNIEITYLLNDMAWIAFTMPVSGIMVWMLVTGIAIVSDKSTPAVFPRWSGYFCFLAATLTAPGFPVALFKSGPFAWNGLLAFWIALVTAFAWIILMSVLIIRAVNKEAEALE